MENLEDSKLKAHLRTQGSRKDRRVLRNAFILAPLVYLVLSGTFRNPDYVPVSPGLKACETAQGEVYFIKAPENNFYERK